MTSESKKTSFFSHWFRFLKPAPFRAEIEDPQVVKKRYRYWRFRIFYGMYLGYALFYFTRKSFPFAIAALSNDLGYSKAELGFLGSVLYITYGVSKFVSGIMGDKSNPRYFMATGLILTGMFNILFGLSSSLIFFALFWGLNGWFQGWGWPGCAKLLTHWYSQSERGTWWSLWNTSHNLGGAFIILLATWLSQHYGWRVAMYFPGFICVIVGFFLINRLRDTPQSLGLPSIERYRNDYSSKSNREEKEKTQLSVKKILWDYVLTNKFIWVLALSSFFVYVIRTAVNDWTLLFLVETKGYSYFEAGKCVTFFEIGGFCGGLAAGWSSDKLFRGKRNPINVLFILGTLLSLMGVWFYTGVHWSFDYLLVFSSGFFIFGPQMLIGIACAELSHKKAAATATGFAGTFGYLGAAAAGGPLGHLTTVYGWDGYYSVLTGCALMAALLLFPLWSVKSNPQQA